MTSFYQAWTRRCKSFARLNRIIGAFLLKSLQWHRWMVVAEYILYRCLVFVIDLQVLPMFWRILSVDLLGMMNGLGSHVLDLVLRAAAEVSSWRALEWQWHSRSHR